METGPTPPYRGVIVDQRHSHTDVPLKFYFGDIRDRDDPSKTEWAYTPDDLKPRLVQNVVTLLDHRINIDVPHIVLAFPHVTTIYHTGEPSLGGRETNWHHKHYTTSTLDATFVKNPSDPSMCNLAVDVLAAEAKLFRELSVEEFISRFALPIGYEAHVPEPNKLWDYRIRKRAERTGQIKA